MSKKQEKEQDAGSVGATGISEEEEAQRRLTIAKRNFTRAVNLLHDNNKSDQSIPRNALMGHDLMATMARRFEELNSRYDDYEVYYEFDQQEEDDRKESQHRFTLVKGDFEVWIRSVPSSATTSPSTMPGGTSQLLPLVGMNFNIRRMINEKFDGSDLRRYPEFRIQFDLVAQHMTQLGYRDAQKLLELKKVLDGTALDIIRQLPLEDGNFENALKLLDVNYKRPIKFTELVISDLLHAPKMGNDRQSINTTLIAIETAEQALKGLKLSRAQAGDLLFTVICESKLNKSIVREWTRFKDKKKDDAQPSGHSATMDDLKAIIRQQKDLEEVFEQRRSTEANTREDGGKKKEERKMKEERNRGTVQGSFAGLQKGGQDRKCLICDKPGHKAADCFSLTKAKNVQERLRILNNNPKLCNNCLRGMHPVNECRQSPQCSKCKRKHHTLLHTEQRQASATSNAGIARPQEDATTGLPPQQVNAAMKSGQRTALLQTCVAWAVSPAGERFLVRVFLDSGSELTMIRRDLAKRMGLNGPAFDLSLTGVGGISVPPTKERLVSLRLMSKTGDYVSPDLKAVTRTELTGRLRKADIDIQQFDHLKNIAFTEDFPREEVTVDVLIGVADFSILTDGDVIRGNPNEPVAMATKLGYVLCGPA